MANFAKESQNIHCRILNFFFGLPSGNFFPKKPTKLNDFVQFFSLQVLMSSCFFQNLLTKKSLYAFFFLQFQQSRIRMNKVFKLSFYLQTNFVQKNKKVFPQNILIVFQSFST